MPQATNDNITVPLSQLLYTHEKLENLARGPLPPELLHEVQDTTCGFVVAIGKARATTWVEFDKKIAVLLADYDDAERFLDEIRCDLLSLTRNEPRPRAAE